jgi:hypothetical protein
MLREAVDSCAGPDAVRTADDQGHVDQFGPETSVHLARGAVFAELVAVVRRDHQKRVLQ